MSDYIDSMLLGKYSLQKSLAVSWWYDRKVWIIQQGSQSWFILHQSMHWRNIWGFKDDRYYQNELTDCPDQR